MIRVVLAEDQSLLRGALATLLSLESDIEIVAQARNGREAISYVNEHKPDVLVTDIEMPELTGIELAAVITGVEPSSSSAGRVENVGEVKVLIVTTFARPGYLQRAMKAGATGYFLKDTPSEELAAAVRKVAAGDICIDDALARSALEEVDPLTEREREILRLVSAGKTNKEIGDHLNLSAGTVRNYLAEATQKLGATNRIEAVRTARDGGWL